MGGAVFGACLLVAAVASVITGSDAGDRDDCQFQQTWYAGDQHFNETIEFRDDATGTWSSGGFAHDAPHVRKDFRWTRTASTLTVTYDQDVRTTVDYELERRTERCSLRFHDHPFAAVGGAFRWFRETAW